MARTPFGKTRKTMDPYAIYQRGDWTWHVLKTYKHPEKEAGDMYARWFVAAKSPMTYGDFDMGDTYATEITNIGNLVAASPEWAEHYAKGVELPTPQDHLLMDNNIMKALSEFIA